MEKACRVVIVDALGAGSGVRYSSRDAVGSGPRRIAGVLESRGLVARILPAEAAINRPSLLYQFDVLMVSAMSIDEKAVHRIIGLWRQKQGTKLAIIGGPIAGQPEHLVGAGYDVVVSGEGERSVEELLKNGLYTGELPRKLRRVALIDGRVCATEIGSFSEWRRGNGSLYDYACSRETLDSFNPSITCIRDYPSYRALKFYVEAVRGCSNFLRTSIPLPDGRKCIDCMKCRDGELDERMQCSQDIPPGCGFCSVPNVFGCSRSRDEGKIVREVLEMVRAGVRRITISASDFLDYQRDKLVAPLPLSDPHHPPPNIAGIESLLSKLASIERKLSIPEKDYVYISVENVKPCLFNDEVASIIAEFLPDSTIHLGCETGSEEHSQKLGRPSTPAQTLEAVRVAVRHGLRPYVYFIHGLPGQTALTARKTVEVMGDMIEANAEKITIYRFKPLALSAFEKFPPALPAKKDKNSKKIEKAARRLNMESKQKLIGKIMNVITYGPISEAKRKGMITYPVSDGPVVLLTGEDARQGERLKVKITEVLSDRLVRGEPF